MEQASAQRGRGRGRGRGRTVRASTAPQRPPAPDRAAVSGTQGQHKPPPRPSQRPSTTYGAPPPVRGGGAPPPRPAAPSAAAVAAVTPPRPAAPSTAAVAAATRTRGATTPARPEHHGQVPAFHIPKRAPPKPGTSAQHSKGSPTSSPNQAPPSVPSTKSLPATPSSSGALPQVPSRAGRAIPRESQSATPPRSFAMAPESRSTSQHRGRRRSRSLTSITAEAAGLAREDTDGGGGNAPPTRGRVTRTSRGRGQRGRGRGGPVLMRGRSASSVAPPGDESGGPAYYVNNVRLTKEEMQPLFEGAGSELPEGRYWYDRACGLFGLAYGPGVSFIAPGLHLGGGEMAEDVSRGRSGVWLNGRQLHQGDITLLSCIGVACTPGRWTLDADGNIGHDASEPMRKASGADLLQGSISRLRSDTASDTTTVVEVSVPEFMRAEEEVLYHIELTLMRVNKSGGSGGKVLGHWNEWKSWDHVQKMHKTLKKRLPSVALPSFPVSMALVRSKDELYEVRRQGLDKYLAAVLALEPVRECISALSRIGVYQALTDPEEKKKVSMSGRQNWKQPLKALPVEQRVDVALLFSYLSRGNVSYKLARWPGPLFPALLARLDVGARVNPIEVVSLPPPALSHQLQESDRWAILWELILQSLLLGGLDARVHVSMQQAATLLDLSLEEFAEVERECAEFLRKQLTEMEQSPEDVKKSSESKNRNLKLGIAAAVGGGLLVVAGIVAAPLMVPVIVGGAALAAGALAAVPLVGAGIATGVVMGGGILAITSPAVLPVVFGAAGAGLASYNVHKLTHGITDFRFVLVPARDPSVERDDDEIHETWDVSDWGSGEITTVDPKGGEMHSALANARELPVDDSQADGSARRAAPPPPARPGGAPPPPARRPSRPAPMLRNSKPVPTEPPPPVSRASKPALQRPGVGSPEHDEDMLERKESKSWMRKFSSSRITRLTKKDSKGELNEGGEKDKSGDELPRDGTPSWGRRALSKASSATSVIRDRVPGSGSGIGKEKLETEVSKEEQLENSGLTVTICVNGWLWKEQDIRTNFDTVKALNCATEVYSLKWETEQLLELGSSLVETLVKVVGGQIAKFWLTAMSGLAATAFAALAWPAIALSAFNVLSNPWTIVSDRAVKAGKVLAHALLSKAQGNRPVTLIGWSLGGRVVFSALECLAAHHKRTEVIEEFKDVSVEGIIENVFLIGAAASASKKRWKSVREIVAGRMVNAYSKADYVLALVHRGANLSARSVAGLEAIKLDGVQDVDVTYLVGGHLNYRKSLPALFRYLKIESSVDEAGWNYSAELDPELLQQMEEMQRKKEKYEAGMRQREQANARR